MLANGHEHFGAICERGISQGEQNQIARTSDSGGLITQIDARCSQQQYDHLYRLHRCRHVHSAESFAWGKLANT